MERSSATLGVVAAASRQRYGGLVTDAEQHAAAQHEVDGAHSATAPHDAQLLDAAPRTVPMPRAARRTSATDAVCTQPRFEFSIPVADPYFEAARAQLPVLTDEQLKDTAIVTFASGDRSARMVTALLQSIRDVGTRIPNVEVMLVRGGHGSSWCDVYDRRERRGWGMYWPCSSPDAVATDIVSPEYLAAWERLGARYRVLDPTPDREFSGFKGDRGAWWGMALSKLLIWTFTHYRRVLWMDGDTLLLHNVDHVMLEPDFTTSPMQECESDGSGFKTSGSFWVLDPNRRIYDELLEFMDHPVPYTVNDQFVFGDMQVVGHFFGDQDPQAYQRPFPYLRDATAGTVPNLHFFPEFRGKTEAELVARFEYDVPPQLLKYREQGRWIQGTLPEILANVSQRTRPLWRSLDARYDGVVGNCRILEEFSRSFCYEYFSVHYTCMPTLVHVRKPAEYTSEFALLTDVHTRMPRCMRHFFLRWYDAYVRAMGEPLPAPLYNGTTVRVDDPESDALFAAAFKAERGQ